MSAEHDAIALADIRAWRANRDAQSSATAVSMHIDDVDLLLRIADERDQLRRELCAEPAPRKPVDWRVLGGLVPGVIHAEWLRDGDRIRINTMEGVVRAHVIDRAAGFVNFVFVTERGQVINTRSLDSEVRVIAATTGADQ